MKENFNLEEMLKEPDFSVNPEKYIRRMEVLISDIDTHIEHIKGDMDKQSVVEKFGKTLELIMSEYQREVVSSVIKCLKFNAR